MESVLVVVDGSAAGISGLMDIVSRAAQRIQSTAGQSEQDPLGMPSDGLFCTVTSASDGGANQPVWSVSV